MYWHWCLTPRMYADHKYTKYINYHTYCIVCKQRVDLSLMVLMMIMMMMVFFHLLVCLRFWVFVCHLHLPAAPIQCANSLACLKWNIKHKTPTLKSKPNNRSIVAAPHHDSPRNAIHLFCFYLVYLLFDSSL